jgi:hypothetical protein
MVLLLIDYETAYTIEIAGRQATAGCTLSDQAMVSETTFSSALFGAIVRVFACIGKCHVQGLHE